MKLDELQREAGQLSPEEQRKLIGFLVAMGVRRDEAFQAELTRGIEDRNPENWVSLKEAKRLLSVDEI